MDGDPILNHDITEQEIDKALSQLKPGKAAGIDTLIPELFINGKSIVLPFLTNVVVTPTSRLRDLRVIYEQKLVKMAFHQELVPDRMERFKTVGKLFPSGQLGAGSYVGRKLLTNWSYVTRGLVCHSAWT